MGLLTGDMLTEPNNSRSLDRRRVYIGEGLSFQIESETAWLEAEAIDLTHEGLGVAVLLAMDVTMPAVGEAVTVRYTGRGASGEHQQAVVRHVGSLQTGRGTFPRIGLSLVADTTRVADVDRRAGVRYPCPDELPAFAAATCPWFFGETLHFRIAQVGAGGLMLRTTQPDPPLPPRAELDLELHLASITHQRGRARLTSVRRDEADGALEVGAAWVDPPRELLSALSRYLLAGDRQLTPAALRAGGLPVRGVEQVVTYDYATSPPDYEEILALRLHAHQAEGHLDGTTTADLRSPFDAHSRHLTCRFGGRIVGYVRAIFVDGDPARSQYVSLGGHEVPQWLWDAGFVEGGAGATHPDFQRAG
ncbi:MAG: PilZ domain-containing protein, partial [Solirubrobacteraceae bacterium]